MDIGALLTGVIQGYLGLRNLGKALGSGDASEEELEAAPAERRGRKAPQMEFHRVRNLDDRIKYIQKMIAKGRRDGRVREVATKILTRRCGNDWCTPEKDWRAEVETIFVALRSRYYRYVRDSVGVDLYQQPGRTLEFRGGDCDDASSLLASMLLSVGYPVQLRVIQTKDADDWNHIYILVLLPPSGGPKARWMPLDLSVNKPPFWEVPKSMIARVKDYPVPL